MWFCDFTPVVGHEQGGIRPCLILSDDAFNVSGAGVVFVAPITSRRKGYRTHVEMQPPEGGLSRASFVVTEATRSVSVQRLHHRTGTASPATLAAVSGHLRRLLALR